MNITFMIGNGFDLGCGLKTRYKDVYDEYCITASSSAIIQKFKDEIGSAYDTWADFEMAMNSYLPTFKKEEDFILCLRDFGNFMIGYLKREEEAFLGILGGMDTAKKMLERPFNDAISSFYKGVSNNIDRKVGTIMALKPRMGFISFNYTKAFDTALSCCKGQDGVIHVHGTIGDAPIFGIDNESQLLPNGKFSLSNKGKRSFIKPVFNSEYDDKRSEDAKNAIKNSDIICVFGLSLGESDLRWRNLLIDWLNNNPNRELFVYDFKWSCTSHINVQHRMDNEDDAKAEWLNRMNVNEDIAREIYQQIHIPCGRNIFQIKDSIAFARVNKEIAK